MKKKYRKITVDGIDYSWSYDGGSEDFAGCFIKIWFNKQVIHNEFHEKINIVTPKIVSEIIKTIKT